MYYMWRTWLSQAMTLDLSYNHAQICLQIFVLMN
jgi:hypothetical protein